MHGLRWRAVVVGLCAGALGLPIAGAQGTPPTDNGGTQGAPAAGGTGGGGRRGQYAGMGRVMGEVTSVNGNTVSLKTEDGSTAQVVTTDNTRLMKDGATIKLTDLHPGDGLMAVGNMDAPNKTLHAAMVMAEDAAQVKAMHDNLGKTYITGRVTAVDLDNARMTVERPDHQAQVIGFDETTSFKRAVRGGGSGGAGSNGEAGGSNAGAGRGAGGGGFGGRPMGMGAGGIDRAYSNGESITLADIKVGDFVAGTGTVKSGTFVPVHLVDSPPGQRRARSGEGNGAAPAQPATPGPAER